MSDSSGTEVGSLYYKLGIDDSTFAAALQKSGDTLKQSLTAANSAVDAARAKTVTAAQQVEQAESRLVSLRSSGNASTQQLAKAEEQVASAHAKSEKATLSLMQAEEKAATAAKNLVSAQDDIDSSAGKQQESVNSLKDSVNNAAQAYGVFAAAQNLWQNTAGYDSAIKYIYTLIPQASAKVKAQVAQDVQDISTKYGIAGTDAARGFYQGLSSGISTDDIKGFMDTTAKAAIAGGVSTDVASDVLSSAVNAFKDQGVTVQKAADSMFMAVNLGKVEFSDLASNMGKVMPIADSLGVKFDEVTGAVAAMTTYSGIQAPEAITYLTGALSELSNTNMKAGKTFEQITGKSFPDFVKGGGTVAQAFNILQNQADKTGVQVGTLFGNVESGRAVMALAGKHAQDYADVMKQMGQETGTVDQGFKTMSDTLQFKWNVAWQQFQVGLRSAGDGIAPLVLDLGKIAEGVGKVMSIAPGATSTIAEMALAGFALNKVMAMDSVKAAIAALRGYQTALGEEVVAADAATAANERLAASRTGLLGRAGSGAMAFGKAALPLYAGLGVVNAVEGASDPKLVNYFESQKDGLGGNFGAHIAAAGANGAHFLAFGLLDGLTGYNDAQKWTDQQQQQKTTDQLKTQAQQAIDTAKQSATGLTKAQQGVADAVSNGSNDTINASLQSAQQVQQAIDQATAQLTSSIDWSKKADGRYTTVDPQAAKAAQRTLADAKNTQASTEQKLADARKNSKSTAQDLADAENALADAKDRVAQAQDAYNKASKPQDQSLAPTDILANLDSQVQSAMNQALDVQKMYSAGLKPEAIQKMLDIEKSHPGSLDRFVQQDLTEPIVEKINDGLGKLDGANNVIAQALNDQLNAAADQAAQNAYDQGYKTGQTFAMGIKDGMNQNGGVSVGGGTSGSGSVGNIGGKSGGGSGGSGIVIGTMNVQSQTPSQWQQTAANLAARNNLGWQH